jgi:membrane protein DedA with SNARE-associated domain
MIIYPTADLSWMLILIGSIAIGIIIGMFIGFFIGRKYGRKEEPKAWQLQRHFRAEAERHATKSIYRGSVIKAIRMLLADPELGEDD